MADNVTGQFGQEDIILNNAATEATLKQILEMQKVIAANAAQGFKSGADLDSAIKGLAKKTKDAAAAGKKFTGSTKRAYLAQQENTEAVEDNTDAFKKSSNRLNFFKDVLGKVAGGALGLLKATSKVASSFSSMDGSLSGATSALAASGSAIKGLGMASEALEATYGPTVAALDKTRAAFQETAAVGANFGSNMNGVVKAAGEAGLSLTEYAGVVKNNSEAMMLLGGSTAEGAKRLARLSSEMRKTTLFDDLTRLGYGTVEINEGFANYTKLMTRNGRIQGLTDKQLREGTHRYLKNLDAVSKLTGKSKESLQAEEDARQADAQYRVMMSGLDAKGREEMELLMKTIPAQHQAGLKEILATGTATTQAGIDAMAYLKESGKNAQDLHYQMKQSGTLTREQSLQFNKAYQQELQALAKSPLMETLGKFVPEANDLVTGVFDVAGRTKDLETIYAEIEANLKKRRDGTKDDEEDEDLVDPATIEKFRNTINEAANKMTANLNTIDISKLQSLFETVSMNAADIAPKMLGKAAEHFDKIAASAVAAEIALMALAAAAGLAAIGQGAGAVRGLKNLKKPPKNVPKPGKPPTTGGVKPGSMMKNIGKGVAKGLRFIPGVGLVAMAGMAAFEGFSAGANAEEYLGLDEGEAATAGERASSTIGGIVDSLTFGLIDGQNVAKKLVDITGAGVNTIEEYEAEIAKEKERLERSLAGENEYWGRESKGQEASREKILEMEQKIAELKAEELKKQQEAGNQMPAEFSGGTLGSLGKLFGNFGSGTPATLHGLEAVTTPAQMAEVVASGVTGTMQSFIGNVQNMLKADEEKAVKDITSTGAKPLTSAAMASATTKSPNEIMIELNTSIQELVALQRMSNSLTQKHIGVTSGLTNDAFSV